MGSKSGFQQKVKEIAPKAKGVHCVIHRYGLASKTLSLSLKEVLDSVVKMVNYIKSGALNTQLFRNFCKDMHFDHEALLLC